jgi:hypothetical protein
MPQDPRKRQKALARQAAQRKQKQALLRREAQQERELSSAGANAVRKAASWPVHEVYLSREWPNPAQLTQILISRRGPAGQIVAGVFLVDRACLGVKNAFARGFASATDYRLDLRDHFGDLDELVPGDANLAAKILREAIAYARNLGFEPHPDYYLPSVLLADARPDAWPGEIRVGGPNGKPLYVSGPSDNVPRILAVLNRKLGAGGFEFLAGSPQGLLLGSEDLMLPGVDSEGEPEEKE